MVDAIDSETKQLVVVSAQYQFEFEQNFDINRLLYMILILMKIKSWKRKDFFWRHQIMIPICAHDIDRLISLLWVIPVTDLIMEYIQFKSNININSYENCLPRNCLPIMCWGSDLIFINILLRLKSFLYGIFIRIKIYIS